MPFDPRDLLGSHHSGLRAAEHWQRKEVGRLQSVKYLGSSGPNYIGTNGTQLQQWEESK